MFEDGALLVSWRSRGQEQTRWVQIKHPVSAFPSSKALLSCLVGQELSGGSCFG